MFGEIFKRIYFVFSFLAFFSVGLNAQTTKEILKIVDSFFMEISKDSTLKYTSFYEHNSFAPFYEVSTYSSSFKQEKIKAGAECKSFSISKKLTLLKKIYTTFYRKNGSSKFSLVDKNGQLIYDLERYNCMGMVGEIGSVKLINQDEVRRLEESYSKWYSELKEKGAKYINDSGKTPMDNTGLVWLEETGYIPDSSDYKLIFKVGKELFSSKDYTKHFLNSLGIRNLYASSLSDNEIMAELLFLSLLNQIKPFTPNILDFSAQYLADNQGLYPIMESIFLLQEDLRLSRFLQLIGGKQVVVKLRL